MRRNAFIALASLVFLSLLPPAGAIAQEDGDLPEAVAAKIDQWFGENDACRGGSGDDEATFEACDRRDALVDDLRDLGWCYGHDGQYEYQREWEACVE
jgi:hypothetical protein